MLQRLTSRLKFLTGGARDLPERQRTLRATIEWSFALLDEGEQLLFGRLAVFSGGARWKPLRPSATQKVICPWTPSRASPPCLTRASSGRRKDPTGSLDS
jgi:predicted ATPase